jgi:hypothetical protein
MNRVVCTFLIFTILVSLLPISHSQASPEAPNISSGNRSLLLDGAGDYLRVNHAPELNPASAITIEAWVNPDTVSGCHTVLGKDYTQAYWLGICNGKIRFYPHGATSSVDGIASIPAGAWTHVAVTYDGTTRRYYINGALDLNSTINPGPLTASTDDLAIGADLGTGTLYEWDGALDEVHLWNRALTQSEIQTNRYNDVYIGGSGSGLVGEWRLDGAGYDYDYTGGANHGIAQGNATYSASGVEPDSVNLKQSANAFTMDGVCNPAEYAGAYEYITGFSSTYLVHNLENVYICFPSLEKGNNRWASVAFDMDYDHTNAPDDQDYLFTIDINNVKTAQTGNGSTWVSFSPPPDFWEAARYNDPGNEFTWSAEFRFPASAFGWTPGYEHTFGVALFEGFTGQTSKSFPGGADEDIPASWGNGILSTIAATSTSWTFSGSVQNEQTGGGIANVPVQLIQSTSGGTFLLDVSTTNGSGNFSFSHTGLAGGVFIVQAQDATGYSSVSAAVGSDGRVISPNLVSYNATVAGGTYSPATFLDTQNLPEHRAFNRHYIIVYSSPVQYSDLWPLIEMKKLEGYQVETANVSTIEASTAGYDRAEKIRNYLNARWQALRPQPIYALLVGRHDLIPVRDLGWLGDADHRTPGEDNYAPAVVTDWYYADLDSNWDTDGDHFYGEYLYCDPSTYIVPIEGADLPGQCPPVGSPLREGPYGASASASDDWIPEISLGRLLINDRAEVNWALRTSVRSESSGDLVKRDALLAAAMWFLNGRSWDTATNTYLVGQGNGILGGWPNPVARPLGPDAAINLETFIKPGLASHMSLVDTLYETTSPYSGEGLIPTSFTPTAGLDEATFNDYFDNGYGLVNVNGHGDPTGVYRIAWVRDQNNNRQVENPANPAETAACTRNCTELAWADYISADVSSPGVVAPIIFANACSTGAWIKETFVAGERVFVADDRSVAGRIPAQGKAAAWIGGLNIVPVYSLDRLQNNFNLDIITQPLLLGDAFWKGMIQAHADAVWDWRMHTPMLFGDPAYSYWGNPLNMDAPWPQGGQNWFSSGATLFNGPDSGTIYWTRSNTTPASPPVISISGNVIVGSQNGLTAFSSNGNVVLTASPGGTVTQSPAVATDGVYFVSGSTLYEYIPALSQRRAISLGSNATGEPHIGPDGVVWVPTTLGMARVTGANIPEILDGGAALTPAALTLSGAAVWVGNTSTLHGYFIDQRGQITRDALTLSGAGALTPPATAPNGDVYVGGNNSILYKIPGGFPFPATATQVFDSIGPIVARPTIGDDGSIYFGTQNGGLYGLNPDGSVRWMKILPGALVAAPALDPNRLYVVFGSELRVYEPVSGGFLWSVNLGDTTGAQSTPVIGAGRMLYVTLNNGKLVAVGPNLAISLPENLRLTPGPGNVTLQWDDTSSNETGFRVEYCVLNQSCQLISTTTANTTQILIGQMKPGETMRFRVQAVGSFGGNGPQSPADDPGYSSEFAYSEYTTITPPAPVPPNNLNAEATSAEGIRLAWEYSGPNADLLTGFRIYRSASSGGPYSEVGSVGASTLAFDDSGLTPGTTYYYKVAAETTGGLSAQSSFASAPTRGQSLPAPSNFTAVQQDNLSVLLTWQDNANGETGYLVERKLPATNEYVLTAMLPANATTYTDPAALLSEGGISYRVRAYTASDESLPTLAYVNYEIASDYQVFLPMLTR